MEILLQLPESVAARFGNSPEEASRQLLENAAVEGYRSRQLSRGQVRELLHLDWHETEEFLAKHGCFRHYSETDLAEDLEALAKIPQP